MTHIMNARREITKLLNRLQEPGNVDQQTMDCYGVIGEHLEQALNELNCAEQQVCSLGLP